MSLPRHPLAWKLSKTLPGKSGEQLLKNNYRKNEMARPKKKQCSVVDLSGDESKI